MREGRDEGEGGREGGGGEGKGREGGGVGERREGKRGGRDGGGMGNPLSKIPSLKYMKKDSAITHY